MSLPVSENRGISCPSFSFVVHIYIPVNMGLLALTGVISFLLCTHADAETLVCTVFWFPWTDQVI